MRLAGGRPEAAMPDQHLDDSDVGAGFQEMGGETMPERSNRDFFIQPRGFSRSPAAAAGWVLRLEIKPVVGIAEWSQRRTLQPFIQAGLTSPYAWAFH
jgi:hypothetical protein